MKTFIYGILMLSLIGSLQISSVRADADDNITSFEQALEDNKKEIEERQEKIEDLEKLVKKMREDVEKKLEDIKEYGGLEKVKSDGTATNEKTDKYEKKLDDELPKESKLDEEDEIKDYAEKIKKEVTAMKIEPCQNKLKVDSQTEIDPTHTNRDCKEQKDANEKLAKELLAKMKKLDSSEKEEEKKKYLSGLYDLIKNLKGKQATAKKLSKAFKDAIDGNKTIATLEEKNEHLEDLNCDLEEDKNQFAYLAEGSMGNVNALAGNIDHALSVIGAQNGTIQRMVDWNMQERMYNYYSPFAGFRVHGHIPGPGYLPGYGQHDVFRNPGMAFGLQNFGPSMNIIQTPLLPQYEQNKSYDRRNYQEMVWDV